MPLFFSVSRQEYSKHTFGFSGLALLLISVRVCACVPFAYGAATSTDVMTCPLGARRGAIGESHVIPVSARAQRNAAEAKK